MKQIKLNKQTGFSLLEIVIAFSILALSLGILLKIFSGGVNSAAIAEDYTVAVQIAEGLMARAGTETLLVANEDSGVINEKYDWVLTITPYIFNTDDSGLIPNTGQLFKVKVLVTWDMRNTQHRQIELTTLKLSTKVL
ncbi:MAG: type II secretion system protein [Methylococcales bacterium]|nr:type II secretion system protein [Methylococcales bacterium]